MVSRSSKLSIQYDLVQTTSLCTTLQAYSMTFISFEHSTYLTIRIQYDSYSVALHFIKYELRKNYYCIISTHYTVNSINGTIRT